AAGSAPREGWLFPHIFRTFRVALDPKKSLLAAAGIVLMALGWWLISILFYNGWSQPSLDKYHARPASYFDNKYKDKSAEERERLRLEEEAERNREFNEDSDRWLHLHRLAGNGIATVKYQPENGQQRPPRSVWGGRLRTMPWYEDRGPNPYFLVTRQTPWPWVSGQFWDWVIDTEVPVLLEPLVKFLEPIVSWLSPTSPTS